MSKYSQEDIRNIRKMLDWLQKNYAKKRSPEQLAKELHEVAKKLSEEKNVSVPRSE